MSNPTRQELQDTANQSIVRVRTDPVWFLKQAFNIDLDIWQVEAFEAMADIVRNKYNTQPELFNYSGPLLPTKYNHDALTKFTIRAMHGPGKTFFAAAAIVWFHCAFKGYSPATAPTIKQLRNRLWPNIRKIQGMANPFWRKAFEVRATEVEWYKDPNWKCVAETGATPENLQGYHDNYMLIVADEASGIDEEMFPVIDGALSTGIIVILLLIGNPTKLLGTFADSHLKPKVAKYYYQIHVDLRKTTRVNPSWVKEMEEKYGKDSPVVRVRCYGEFAEEDENQLLSLEWIVASRSKPYRSDGSIPRQRITVDCSDGGGNFTVVTNSVRHASFTLFKKQSKYSFPQGTAATRTRDIVKKIWVDNGMDKRNGDDIVVDSLGVGAGVASMLIEGGFPVIRYMGGAASDNSAEWRNRRVQSYMVLRDNYRDGKIITADDYIAEEDWDDHDAQLCSIRRKAGTENREDLLTKQEMVDKGIVSPDRADSEAMQFATQSPILTPGGPILIGRTLETASYDGSITHHF
jgi:uncharacterized protein YndB with AHSA1/START domain